MRPLNEDDKDEADNKVAAHYMRSEPVRGQPRQVSPVWMCSLHLKY